MMIPLLRTVLGELKLALHETTDMGELKLALQKIK